VTKADIKEPLVVLLQLLGRQSKSLPVGYKNAKLTFFRRLEQMATGYLTGFQSLFNSKTLVICGKNLPYFTGRVEIRKTGFSIYALKRSIRREGVILVAKGKDVDSVFSTFTAAIGLDSMSSIMARLSENPTIVFFGEHHGRNAVVHVSTCSEGRKSIERHRNGTLGATIATQGMELGHLITSVMDYREHDSQLVLVQSLLPGCGQENLKSITFAQLHQHITTAVEISASFPNHDFHSSRQPGEEFLKTSIPEMVKAVPPEYRTIIKDVSRQILQWLNLSTLQTTLSHGDFWIGNLLFSSDGKRVMGIIDWEWFNANEIPYIDGLQCIVMSYAKWSNQHIGKTLAQIYQVESLDKELAQLLLEFRLRFDLTDSDIKHLTAYLWLKTIWQGFVETTPTRETWLPDMIDKIEPCLRRSFLETTSSNSIVKQ
jgi:phosphotransferase family enzyme